MPIDPMMEIFMAECQDLISQYETYLSMAEEKQEYDLNLINEIFRITHTLKADATMMLYECVAVPMRAYEKVLYYCRDEAKGLVDYKEFSSLLTEMIEYTAEEVTRIEAGVADEHDGDELEERVLAYRNQLASKMHPDQVETVEEHAKGKLKAEPMRFYIGGQTESIETNIEKLKTPKIPDSEEDRKQQKEKETIARTSEEERYQHLNQKQTVTVEELRNLQRLIDQLQHLGVQITNRFPAMISENSDIYSEYQARINELYDWVTRAWMTPVSYLSPKLRRTVEEMNARLGSQVQLTIEGESLLVKKGWMERLSAIMIHLIRNSIDHGFECKKLRINKEKNPDGNITVRYQTIEEGKLFELTFADDGRGVPMENLKEAAIQRGLLQAEDQPSKEELLKLMFVPGLTTNQKVGEYSGRGVGMDVVWHNVQEIGGEIRVDSALGQGTKVIIRIPYSDTVLLGGDYFNEDIDSRR